VAAAVVLLAAMFLPGMRAQDDSKALKDKTKLAQTKTIIQEINQNGNQWGILSGQDIQQEQAMRKRAELLGYRDFWPSMMAVIEESVRTVTPDQPLMMDYARMLEYHQYVDVAVQDQISTGTGIKDANGLYKAASILMEAGELGALKDSLSKAGAATLKLRGRKLIDQIKPDPNTLAAANEALAKEGEPLKLQVLRLELLKRITQAQAFKAKPRSQRQVIIVEGMDATYYPDIGAAMATQGESNRSSTGKPGFKITLLARTPLDIQTANKMVARLGKYSSEYAKWFTSFKIVEDYRAEWLPSAASAIRTVVGAPDVETRGDQLMDEAITADNRFRIIWFVEIASDGVVLADVRTQPGRNQYVIGKEASLYPDFEPADALAAAGKIVKLPQGSKLTIEEVRLKSTVPWYRVSVESAGKSVSGWVSGVSINQQLQSAAQAGA
jgi:hypothetical protein